MDQEMDKSFESKHREPSKKEVSSCVSLSLFDIIEHAAPHVSGRPLCEKPNILRQGALADAHGLTSWVSMRSKGPCLGRLATGWQKMSVLHLAETLTRHTKGEQGPRRQDIVQV